MSWLIIPMALVVAAGFIFLWHTWIIRRGVLWLTLSILLTFIVTICFIFGIATLILMLV